MFQVWSLRSKKNIWKLFNLSDPYTKEWRTVLKLPVESWSWRIYRQANRVAAACLCITVLIMHSKSICQVTLYSLDLCIFSFLESWVCLVYAVKGCLNRWTFWLMKPISSVRGRMQWCRIYIIFLRILDLGRQTWTSIVTTAQARIRIAICFGTVHGEMPTVSTSQ